MRPFLMILLSVVGGWLAYQLRVVHLFEPEWLDERHTAWVLSGGWGSIWERAALGNQPALYFAGLKLLGLSDVSPGWLLRLPSLLANLLLVVGLPCGLYLWTRRVSAALVSCAMLAVQSDLLYYATEARVYGVLTTVALLQILVVAARLGLAGLGDAQRPTLTLRVVSIALSVTLVWLHFTALLLLIAEALAALMQVRFDPRRRLVTWLRSTAGRDLAIDSGVIAMALLPLLPVMRNVGSHRQAWQAFVRLSADQIEPFAQLAFWALLVPIAALAIDRWSRARRTSTRDSKEGEVDPVLDTEPAPGATPTGVPDTIGLAWFASAATLIAWGIAAAATAWGETPVFLTRYLIGTWSWLALAAGLWVGTLGGSWTRPMVAVILSAIFVANSEIPIGYAWGQWPVYRTERWRELTDRLNADENANLPVTLYGGIIEEEQLADGGGPPLQAYLKFPLVGVTHPERVRARPSDQPLPLPMHDEGDLIVVRDDPNDPYLTQELAAAWREANRRTGQPGEVEVRMFGSVGLFRRTVKPTDANARE